MLVLATGRLRPKAVIQYIMFATLLPTLDRYVISLSLCICYLNFMKIKELVTFIVLCGCSIAKPIADNTLKQENLSIHLKYDDILRVDKNDGESKKLKLVSLEDTYLLGQNNQEGTLIIPYSWIEEIRVYQISTGLTLALVVGLPVVGIVGALNTSFNLSGWRWSY